MSLHLLKRTVPEYSSESDEELPKKRERNSEDKLKNLIQEEIDKRLLRPKKQAPKKKSSKKPSQNLLDKCEQKQKKSTSLSTEEKIKILSSRSLPAKYLSLLSKKS